MPSLLHSSRYALAHGRRGALSRRAPLLVVLALAGLSTFPGCAEPEEEADLFEDASQPSVYADAGLLPFGDASYPTFDASSPLPNFDASALIDASPAPYDSSTPGDATSSDAGDSGTFGGLGDFGGLFGGGAPADAGAGVVDASTGNQGKGELDPNGAINPNLPPKADNPKECPSLAPPNPVGNCLGLPIYIGCGYGKPGGAQLSCTCDWYHWLCI